MTTSSCRLFRFFRFFRYADDKPADYNEFLRYRIYSNKRPTSNKHLSLRQKKCIRVHVSTYVVR